MIMTPGDDDDYYYVHDLSRIFGLTSPGVVFDVSITEALALGPAGWCY